MKVSETYLTINGIRTYCKLIGEGEPVVILHGGPGLDHSYLLPHFEVLADKFKLIFYDQRGGGESEGIEDTSKINAQQLVEDLEVLRVEFKLELMNLLGYSWGGLLAMLYAISYQDHLKKLILLSPAPARHGWREEFNRNMTRNRPEKIKERMKELLRLQHEAKDSQKYDDEMFRLSVYGYFHNPVFLSQLTRWKQPKGVAPLASQLVWDSLGEYDIRQQLMKITVPTLILHGRHDPIPLKYAEEIHHLISSSDFVVFEESAHVPFIEEKENFAQAVKAFLQT